MFNMLEFGAKTRRIILPQTHLFQCINIILLGNFGGGL